MVEAIPGALDVPGLGLLVAAAMLAGLVRGFAGFGTGLIFMPMAGAVLPPISAIVVMTAMDVIGLMPQVPRALARAERRDVARMVAGAAVALPLGLWLASGLPVGVFRWSLSFLALGMLALIVAGWRWHGPVGPALGYGTGALSGFLGGASGLAGPPAILLNVASDRPAYVIRANLMSYLVLFGCLLVALFLLTGAAGWADLALAAVLAIPFAAASLLGARLFDPARESFYRGAAYLIIAASALAGLPLWG